MTFKLQLNPSCTCVRKDFSATVSGKAQQDNTSHQMRQTNEVLWKAYLVWIIGPSDTFRCD